MSVLSSCWSADFAVFPAWRGSRARMNPAADFDPSAANAERARVDADLLRRIARDDREAFAQLYDRFSRPLYATALRVLNNPAEAEDIVQDVFLALWEKAASFESTRGSAFAWATRLLFKEQTGAVRAAVAALPPEQQRAVELAFFSGLTQQEIAARLQEPLGTVKARIRRGLLKLREILGGRHD